MRGKIIQIITIRKISICLLKASDRKLAIAGVGFPVFTVKGIARYPLCSLEYYFYPLTRNLLIYMPNIVAKSIIISRDAQVCCEKGCYACGEAKHCKVAT